FQSVLSVSAPLTILARSTIAGSRSRLCFFTMASNAHSLPWCPNSASFRSYGVAFSRSATAITRSVGTKRNSASGSMNFVISHGHATLSTFTRSLVIHFMSCPPSGPPLKHFRSQDLLCERYTIPHIDRSSWMRAGKNHDADDRGDCDQDGFGDFLHFPDQSHRNERYQAAPASVLPCNPRRRSSGASPRDRDTCIRRARPDHQSRCCPVSRNRAQAGRASKVHVRSSRASGWDL